MIRTHTGPPTHWPSSTTVQLLGAIESAITLLHKGANGAYRTPGQRERIGDLKALMRQVRDRLNQAYIEAMEAEEEDP